MHERFYFKSLSFEDGTAVVSQICVLMMTLFAESYIDVTKVTSMTTCGLNQTILKNSCVTY